MDTPTPDTASATPRMLDGRLKLRHLILVDALGQRGSVVSAAEQLHIGQPVVSRALRELEEILGVSLFDRGPRGVTPTIFGIAFIDHARSVLAELLQAGQHMSELATADRGTVTVGTHLAGSNVLLPLAIASLKHTRPKLTVIVQEATPDLLLADLLSGKVDLVIGRLNPLPDEPRITQIELYQEPIRLVTRVGHPAQALPNQNLRDLLDYPWILPGSRTVLRQELEAVFHAENLPLPGDRIECSSILPLRHLLLNTDVIAALPMLIATEDDRLALLSTPLEPIRRTVGVTRRINQMLSPATQALLDHLHAAAAEVRVAVRDGDRAQR